MWTFVGSKENDIWIWLASERSNKALLLALMSEKETMPELLPHFLKTARRTEYFSQAAWPLKEKSFLRKDKELSVKEAEKKAISKGLI